MTGEDIGNGARIGDEQATGPATGDRPVLTEEEKLVLDRLVDCTTSRTAAQLAAACGLGREEVAAALEGLRAKGLATRFNTLVESYAARFPGIEV